MHPSIPKTNMISCPLTGDTCQRLKAYRAVGFHALPRRPCTELLYQLPRLACAPDCAIERLHWLDESRLEIMFKQGPAAAAFKRSIYGHDIGRFPTSFHSLAFFYSVMRRDMMKRNLLALLYVTSIVQIQGRTLQERNDVIAVDEKAPWFCHGDKFFFRPFLSLFSPVNDTGARACLPSPERSFGLAYRLVISSYLSSLMARLLQAVRSMSAQVSVAVPSESMLKLKFCYSF